MFLKLKVIGVGDNVVDKYVNEGIMFPGGQAMNFAVYTKMLGADSAYLGVFGSDRAANIVREAAEAKGVRLNRCIERDGENGYACVEIKGGDRIFLYSNKGGVAAAEPMVLNDEDIAYIKTHDLIYTDDNSRMLSELPKLSAAGIPVVFDFSVRWQTEQIKLFAPFVNIAVLSCADFSYEDMYKAIREVHAKGCQFVMATRAAEGSWFSSGNRGLMVHQEAHMVKAKDSLGAGDSFISAFLLAFIGEKLHTDASGNDTWKEKVGLAMKKGAMFAAEICMVEGAFGFAHKIVE